MVLNVDFPITLGVIYKTLFLIYGLGYLIVYGGQVFKLDLVMMGVFVLAFCAWIMYEILNIAEKLYNSRK